MPCPLLGGTDANPLRAPLASVNSVNCLPVSTSMRTLPTLIYGADGLVDTVVFFSSNSSQSIQNAAGNRSTYFEKWFICHVWGVGPYLSANNCCGVNIMGVKPCASRPGIGPSRGGAPSPPNAPSAPSPPPSPPTASFILASRASSAFFSLISAPIHFFSGSRYLPFLNVSASATNFSISSFSVPFTLNSFQNALSRNTS
mmetsp:Transcript_45335/g.75231  ORF Transcript_45335/g.75231 Transcript_45335/m.75231 type:complete len:200 (-) Transcript_45335:195-794(-)